MKHGLAQTFTRALLIITFGACAFVFFRNFYASANSAYTQEILAAVLGGLIIAVVTAVLLKAQAKSEIEREVSVELFRRKADIYTGFIDRVIEMFADGHIDGTERRELLDWQVRISLLADEDASMSVAALIAQSLISGKLYYKDLDGQQRRELQNWQSTYYPGRLASRKMSEAWFVELGEVVLALREDLARHTGISQGERLQCVNAVNYAVDKILDSHATTASLAGASDTASSVTP